MLSKVLWPSDRAEGEEDYDFVYQLNISDQGRALCGVTVSQSHSLSSDYASSLMLPQGELPLDIELASPASHQLGEYQDNRRLSREECMRKLQTCKSGKVLFEK